MSDVDMSKEDKDRKRDRQPELIKYGFLPILYTFAFFNALNKRMPMHWTINQVAHVHWSQKRLAPLLHKHY